MSWSNARVFRVISYGALEAVVIAATALMVVGLSRSPAAGAATPPTQGASVSAPGPILATLTVEPKPGPSANLVLTAHFTGSASNAGGSVAFFVVTKEFGKDLNVPIGTAKTSQDGAATINYAPTWNGKEQFVATLTSGLSGTATPTATSYHRVTASAPGPLYATANPLRPFSFLGHVFVGMILTMVALIWLTLIGILVLLACRLPRLAGGKDRLE